MAMTAQALPVADLPAIDRHTAPQLPNPVAAAAIEAATDTGGRHWHFHGREAVDAALEALERGDAR
jgi:hypothetical protein